MVALLVVSSITAFSQETSSAVVVLKNGTTLTGKVKQFDPTSKIILNIGGFDTTINMSEVQSITNIGDMQTSASGNVTKTEALEPAVAFPEDTVVNICGVNVKFILMKGGKFKYGFDGRGSLSMESEPVHDVVLSPYYISEELVSRDLYKAVMKTGYPTEFFIKYADKTTNDESLQSRAFFMSENLAKIKKIPSVEDFIKALRGSYGEKFDIPTEVQWFYCESRKSRETKKLKTPMLLYCQFALKVSMSDVQDPVGQSIVVKGYTKHDDKDEIETYRLYDRSQTKRTNIVWWRKLEYKLYKNFSSYNQVPLCPIRLIMQVKQ